MEPVNLEELEKISLRSPTITLSQYNNLAADHARCVQDVRRMALDLQVVVRCTIENDSPCAIGSPECERAIMQDPRWQSAQRMLETWKDGA